MVGGGGVDVGDLIQAPLIMLDRRWPSYEWVQRVLFASSRAPMGAIQVDNVPLAKGLALRGLGVALLPITAVAAELASGLLKRVDLKGATMPSRRVLAIERL